MILEISSSVKDSTISFESFTCKWLARRTVANTGKPLNTKLIIINKYKIFK